MPILSTSCWTLATWASLALAQTTPMPKPATCDIGTAAAPILPVADGPEAEAKAPQTARELLEAIEQSDQDLATLAAGIRYDLLKGVAGDQQIRTGRIVLKNTQPRAFAVRFRELQVGSRVDATAQTYVFDGRFLVEQDEQSKLYVKREIVREGERVDPLRVGQGPFPVPIGQAAEEILARYDAVLVEATDGLEANTPEDQGALEGFVKECVQLVLTPKEATRGESMTKVQLWYRSVGGRWLPRMARTTNREEDVAIIQLINLRVNESLEESDLALTPPPAGEGWTVREELLPAATEPKISEPVSTPPAAQGK